MSHVPKRSQTIDQRLVVEAMKINPVNELREIETYLRRSEVSIWNASDTERVMEMLDSLIRKVATR